MYSAFFIDGLVDISHSLTGQDEMKPSAFQSTLIGKFLGGLLFSVKRNGWLGTASVFPQPQIHSVGSPLTYFVLSLGLLRSNEYFLSHKHKIVTADTVSIAAKSTAKAEKVIFFTLK